MHIHNFADIQERKKRYPCLQESFTKRCKVISMRNASPFQKCPKIMKGGREQQPMTQSTRMCGALCIVASCKWEVWLSSLQACEFQAKNGLIYRLFSYLSDIHCICKRARTNMIMCNRCIYAPFTQVNERILDLIWIHEWCYIKSRAVVVLRCCEMIILCVCLDAHCKGIVNWKCFGCYKKAKVKFHFTSLSFS